MPRQVEQRIDLGDRHLLGTLRELDDLVAGFDLTLLEDAEVEAGAAVRDEQRRNARVVHANADAVTRDARLADLEDCGSDLKAVPDADRVVGEALDGEVLGELTMHEVAAAKLALPIS